jgi:hypothetical protein
MTRSVPNECDRFLEISKEALVLEEVRLIVVECKSHSEVIVIDIRIRSIYFMTTCLLSIDKLSSQVRGLCAHQMRDVQVQHFKCFIP